MAKSVSRNFPKLLLQYNRVLVNQKQNAPNQLEVLNKKFHSSESRLAGILLFFLIDAYFDCVNHVRFKNISVYNILLDVAVSEEQCGWNHFPVVTSVDRK